MKAANKKIRAFTLIEFLLYIGIASIFLVIILPLIGRITKSISFYQSKVNLRNDFSNIIQKINYESKIADDLNILSDWGIMFLKSGSSSEIRLTKPNLINGANVSGFAWGYEVGGISLNCSDFNICGTSDYKVQRNQELNCQISSGNFIPSSFSYQGYAWSPNIGWLKFRDSDYGVCEEQNGNLRGYAWNDVVGWIVFNCIDSNICDTSNFKVLQSNNRLTGYAYNDTMGWLRFDGNEEKIYLWDGNTEEQLTNNFTKAKLFNLKNIGDTIQLNLNLSNLEETKNIISTTTIIKFGK